MPTRTVVLPARGITVSCDNRARDRVHRAQLRMAFEAGAMTVAGRRTGISGADVDQRSDGAQLHSEYQRGDFYFGTGQHAMLARGADTVFEGAELTSLDGRLPDVLTRAASPIAVGNIPFSSEGAETPRAPARLVVPRELRVADAAHSPAHQQQKHPVHVPVQVPAGVSPVPEPARHRAAVTRALDSVRAGTLRKVVLARALDLAFNNELDPGGLLRNLVHDNSGGFTYAAELPHATFGRRTLLGASPELLVRRVGTRVTVHPHAGSSARSADPAVDQRNARSLLASAKDHAEHAMVTEAVVAALRPLCGHLEVPAEPVLTSTTAVWHLGTAITGELRDPDVDAFQLASALHPTPAVCGTPTGQARSLVSELEPFDRDYYAGAVGWVDAAGDGEWAVSIRCAEVAERSMRLYAGGGIVDGSEPEAELAETSAKFRTLLRAMGLELEL